MKNPCEDDCVIRVVCTEVCYKKINYGMLIKNALEQNSIYRKSITNYHCYLAGTSDQYYHYYHLMEKYKQDLEKIKNRKRKKEGYDV